MLKCGYFTSKACIRKNLSIEQWLAQDIYSPCSAREAQSQLQQPRKLGWISWRLGENENTKVLHGSNTSPDSLKCPIMLENTIYHLSSPEGKYPLYPLWVLDEEMNCQYYMCQWTWPLVSINFAYWVFIKCSVSVLSSQLDRFLHQTLKAWRPGTAMQRAELPLYCHIHGGAETSQLC